MFLCGTPLRPIVDYIGSIGYDTSKALADILTPTARTEIEGRTAYRQHMTIFWSHAQHHMTTSLMKLAVGEQNVATNLGTIYRLCYRILF